MNKYVVFILSILFINVSRAEFKFVGSVVSYNKTGDEIELKLTNALFNIYVIDNNIIRFRYTDKNSFSAAPSYAVIYNNEKTIPFRFADDGKYLTISTGDLNVHIFKSPCRLKIYDKDMNLINEDDRSFGVGFDGNEVRCFKELLEGERFYGLGEKTGPLEKTGNQYTMWNSDHPAYNAKTDPLYESIPFFIGVREKKAYGIFFDNTYKSYFNMGASSKRFYWFGADGGEMDYYFIAGPEIKKVISSYTMLTGRMEMPPKWALGYQQSKWSYYPEFKVRDIAKNFREKKIPCDVIYLDIDYMDGYRVFTWDSARFPDPARMLADLKNEGFKIVPIIDPGIKADSNYFAAKEGITDGLFAKYPDGTVYQGEVWPSWSYFPDFTMKKTRDWWGEKLNTLLKTGVEGFWNDMNEPAVWGNSFPDIVRFSDNGFGADHKKIHNVYALEEAKATFDAFHKYSPNKRHFMLTRAGFAGIQRYSAVWTGDNVANNESLRLACTMSLGMGLSGVPFIGSDVGGFIGVGTPNLYTRWMELGAFTPFFRAHSQKNQKDKEPWAFGDEVEKNVKNIISLRYKLLPYIYNEFHNASITGLPLMRPMFFDFQNDDNCYENKAQYQYMFGENILVAPVLDEKSTFKELYLPEGYWYDWWTDKVYQGGKWIIVSAPVDRIPLFIKEGAIIPEQPVEQYVGEKTDSLLTVIVFPSKQSSYDFYEDDGITFNYKKGEYSETEIKSEISGNTGRITVKKIHDGYKSEHKTTLFKVLNISSLSSVKNNLKDLTGYPSKTDLNKIDEGYFFDRIKSTVFIKIPGFDNINISYQK